MSIFLDGFVGQLDGDNDWMLPSMDSGANQWTLETVWLAGFHVMGRKSFQEMATFWPYSSGSFCCAHAPMNAIPKLVFIRGNQSKLEPTREIKPASNILKEGIKISDSAVEANLES